jgi:putative ABC transport system permease protein
LAIADTILSGMEDIPVKKPIFGTAEFIGSFVLMIGLSILIGLIPANRAVRIKPIDALREE